MRFFDSRIVTTPITLKEALDKAKNKPPQRSLDELLDEHDKKQVKTASTDTKVTKVADSVQEEMVEESLEEGEAPTEIELAVSKVASGESLTLDEDPKKDEATEEVKQEEEQAAVVAPDGQSMATQPDTQAETKKTVSLKIARKLDFRNDWKAEDLVKAWNGHGSMEKCMENVKDQTSDPRRYCGLLQVASLKAEKVLKTASTKKEPAVFKKIAKLTAEEKSFLKSYYRQLYGEGYVESLLADY